MDLRGRQRRGLDNIESEADTAASGAKWRMSLHLLGRGRALGKESM